MRFFRIDSSSADGSEPLPTDAAFGTELGALRDQVAALTTEVSRLTARLDPPAST